MAVLNESFRVHLLLHRHKLLRGLSKAGADLDLNISRLQISMTFFFFFLVTAQYDLVFSVNICIKLLRNEEGILWIWGGVKTCINGQNMQISMCQESHLCTFSENLYKNNVIKKLCPKVWQPYNALTLMNLSLCRCLILSCLFFYKYL